jgi:hypothetical protein
MTRAATGSIILIFTLFPALAAAQPAIESLGSRALGMGGAFVGVADDATAVFWNPAGIATGQPYGATIEWNRLRFSDPDAPLVPGPMRRDSTVTAFAAWPVGLSYSRVDSTQLVDRGLGFLETEKLEIRQFGLTFVQTVVQGVVIGATGKYLRGTAGYAPALGADVEEALDIGDDLDIDSEGGWDVDAGIMADFVYARLGVTVKNLFEPDFGEIAANEITLKRQARLGLAVLPAAGVTLAMDVDLNTVGLRDGLRRMFALGGESRLGTRLAVRAGVRWDLEGPKQTITAFGASVAVRPGMWIDGHASLSQHDGDRGFGVAFRSGY